MPRQIPTRVEINSLENGVSEQAAVARDKSQAEEQINLLSDIARGVITRPGTEHIAKLDDAVYSDGEIKVYHINRDASERYKVAFTAGDIAVHDLQTGEVKTVNYPDGKAYLSSSNPGDDFRMITVADTSWVLNRSVTAAMSAETSDEQPHEALIFVKRGMRGHTYTIEAAGRKITVSSEGTQAGWPSECSSEDIAEAFEKVIRYGYNEVQEVYHPEQIIHVPATDLTPAHDEKIAAYTEVVSSSHINGLVEDGFTCDRIGSVIRITYSEDFSFKVYDSYGNQGLVGIKGAIDDFADLPAKCWHGVKVKVTGKDSTGLDDYYVEYRSIDGAEEISGNWVECNGWGLQNTIDAGTMPHHLIREADGTFTFKQIEWAERKVGDDITAPEPSFIGNRIADVFFHLNRFGIASRDKTIFSRDDKYGCFWPRKATEVLDDDSFELSTTGHNIADISFIIPFGKSLVVMCENKQFIITCEKGLSPKEAKITESTTYSASTLASPALAGSNMFFVSPNGDYSILREYFLSEDSINNEAPDITKHIPEYIPKGITLLDAHNNDDLLIGYSPEEPHRLYVYKYLWANNQKIQSSWSYFEFSGKLLHFCYVDNSIYLMTQYSDGVFLERITLFSKELAAGMEYEPALDRRVILNGVYDEAEEVTNFTAPYVIDDISWYRAVAGGGFAGIAGMNLSDLTQTSQTTFSIAGNFSAAGVYFGTPYKWEYKLSTQYVRNEAQSGAPAYTAERTQILDLAVIYKDSGNFVVTVKNRDQVFNYEKSGGIGSRMLIVGQPIIDTGKFTVPVKAQNVNVEIAVNNYGDSDLPDCYAPVAIQKIEWRGYYVKR